MMVCKNVEVVCSVQVCNALDDRSVLLRGEVYDVHLVCSVRLVYNVLACDTLLYDVHSEVYNVHLVYSIRACDIPPYGDRGEVYNVLLVCNVLACDTLLCGVHNDHAVCIHDEVPCGHLDKSLAYIHDALVCIHGVRVYVQAYAVHDVVAVSHENYDSRYNVDLMALMDIYPELVNLQPHRAMTQKLSKKNERNKTS